MIRQQLQRDLARLADSKRAAEMTRFFKTGKGQYGEGDRFLGIPVPVLRKAALRYRELEFADMGRLLASRIHEHRAAALEILVAQYEGGSNGTRDRIVRFYLAHTSRINNWDLVDASAPYILGDYLKTRPRDILYKLAASRSLWERRIAIVSTLALIKHGEIDDTFRIAGLLLSDNHDLIHKAIGWALRETGKVSRAALLKFLTKYYWRIPRTALRYAIEHFSPEQRKQILAGQGLTSSTAGIRF
jgi:3-methyladenine DNA glycosylase AlkD